MAINLEPCPFCGSAPSFHELDGTVRVCCDNDECDANRYNMNASHWNRRAKPEQPDDGIGSRVRYTDGTYSREYEDRAKEQPSEPCTKNATGAQETGAGRTEQPVGLSEFDKWYSDNGFYHDTVSDRKDLMRTAWKAALDSDLYEDVYDQCQELISPHIVELPHGSAAGGNSLVASVVGSLGFLIEFWLKHRGVPKRESGWVLPEIKPETVGLGEEKSVSMPLLFKTVIPDVGTHIRLGYYDAKREAFIESGHPTQTYKERVTCWYQFQMPPITDIEGGK